VGTVFFWLVFFFFLGESEGGRWGGLEDEGIRCTVARGKIWNDKGD